MSVKIVQKHFVETLNCLVKLIKQNSISGNWGCIWVFGMVGEVRSLFNDIDDFV